MPKKTSLYAVHPSITRGYDKETTPEQYLAQAEEWVEDMFAGPKAALRPLYNQILQLAFKLGSDVTASPCKTIVPIYREHVIAQIKPSTRTRIDLGFALGNRPAQGRLLDTGGLAKKDRITHRIPITSAADIDDEVRRWLRVAYEGDK